MNKIYRIVWNEVTATWVAVAEIGKSHSKRSSTVGRVESAALLSLPPLKALVASLMLVWAVAPMPAWAQVAANQLPTGGNVVAGTASVTTTPGAAVLNINQTTNRAAIDWNTFNVGSAAQVNFNQPSSSSVTLNRVLDSNPSQIFGRITAPGQVFLTNPNGVVFAPGARVDVGGLVATTHRIGVEDFMAGSTTFERNGSTASVLNQGELKAALGGYIALLAPQVRNEGVIIAQAGTVVLASGEAITLNFADNGTLAGITATQSQIAALVENQNAVLAPGGLIILSAQAMSRLQGGVINNSGRVEATGLVNNGGRILLDATDSITHTGSINVDAAANSSGNGGTALVIASLANPDSRADINGSISARGGEFGGDGGFVETSAGRVQIGEATRVTTLAPQGSSGTWLIDPTDFAIVAGSGAQTTSSIGATTLQTNLGGGNVSIATAGAGAEAGNINVNAALSWSANKLTLTAHNDININAVMTASGTASLDLAPTSNKVNVALGDGFIGRLDWTSSGALRMNVSGTLETFTVINNVTDLQAINTSGLGGRYALGANIDASAISNFVPIGTFTGVFDGLGHTVSNLTMNRSAAQVGLFGATNGATLRNVGVSGSVMATGDRVGGLAGFAASTNISNSYAAVAVTGPNVVGGLVGQSSGSVTNSYATGVVSGAGNVGGLVGDSDSSNVTNSYATGVVTGTSNSVGGLIGSQNYGSVSNSYATGAVSGADRVGGLVGYGYGTSISKSYATGAVTATSASAYGGGLVGVFIGTSISQSYASGAVTVPGTAYGGGMVGADYSGGGIAASNFWDTVTTTKAASSGGSGGGGTGLTTANALLNSTQYTGFDFTSTWFMVNGQTRPMLRAFFAPLVSGTYTISNLYQLQGMAANLSGSYVLANNINAIATASTNASDIWAGKGFAPVGDFGSNFTGNFNGQSHTISNLTINRPNTDNVGLFGFTYGSTIQNVGLVNVNVTGQEYVGGLAGVAAAYISNSYSTGLVEASDGGVGGLVGGGLGSISNSYSTATVNSTGGRVGGLVGEAFDLTLTNTYATGDVTAGGSSRVGGLVGRSNYSTITNSYATGEVTGERRVGGLIGDGYNDTVTSSYATGAVTGSSTDDYTGGLIGSTSDSAISNSYATGAVSGGSNVGGLIGEMDIASTLTNTFATGNVTGGGYGFNVGGLVGWSRYGSSITRSFATGGVTGNNGVGGLVGLAHDLTVTDTYASGAVTGNNYVGGLVGDFNGAPSTINRSLATGVVSAPGITGGLTGSSLGTPTINDSFWDTVTTGQSTSYGGTAKTTAELRTLANFTDAGWDMTESTAIAAGYPALGFTVSGASTIWVINASAASAPSADPAPVTPVVIPPVIATTPLPPGNGDTVTDAGTGNTGGGAGSSFTSPNPLLNANTALVIPIVISSSSGGAPTELGAGGIAISLNMTATANAVDGAPGGLVTVSVPKGMATSGAGFSFDLPAQLREFLGAGAIQATLADDTPNGSPLPAWIQFNPDTLRFEAGAVPSGGLPLQILLRRGDKQVLITISERAD